MLISSSCSYGSTSTFQTMADSGLRAACANGSDSWGPAEVHLWWSPGWGQKSQTRTCNLTGSWVLLSTIRNKPQSRGISTANKDPHLDHQREWQPTRGWEKTSDDGGGGGGGQGVFSAVRSESTVNSHSQQSVVSDCLHEPREDTLSHSAANY